MHVTSYTDTEETKPKTLKANLRGARSQEIQFASAAAAAGSKRFADPEAIYWKPSAISTEPLVNAAEDLWIEHAYKEHVMHPGRDGV